MSYAIARHVALGLDQSVVDRFRQLGPKCYSADMSDCGNEENTSYPNCAEILALRKDHEDEYLEWSSSTPWCPQAYEKNYTFLPPGYQGVAIAAGGGAVLGLVLGYLLF